jgi:spermidine synthase
MILLDAINSEFGGIEILQRRQSGSLIYRQGGSYQSEADWDGVSLASYIHALYGLILQNDARNVLIIGCGGGTLATMLVKSSRDVTIVDIDPASFAVARKYFNLPATVACRVSDGKYFLRKSSTHYDTIVIDAYQGGHVPAHLETSEFFGLAHKRLSEFGSVFTNIHLLDDHDRRADQIAARMGNTWNDVRILDSEGAYDRNAIVMGGTVSQLQAPEATILPAIDAKLIEQELHCMKFRPCRAQNASGTPRLASNP